MYRQRTIGNLATNVRRLMIHNKLSQQKLAELSGLQQVTISRVLNARHDPAVSVVSTTAEAFETSVDKLLESPPKKNLQRAS